MFAMLFRFGCDYATVCFRFRSIRDNDKRENIVKRQ